MAVNITRAKGFLYNILGNVRFLSVDAIAVVQMSLLRFLLNYCMKFVPDLMLILMGISEKWFNT